MASELELNQPPPPSCEEREALNRTRTWLVSYCADGSHAIQFGKMPMIRLDDYLARNSQDWYKSSTLNTPSDVYICAYVQLLIHVATWRARIRAGLSGQEYEVDHILIDSLFALIDLFILLAQRYCGLNTQHSGNSFS